MLCNDLLNYVMFNKKKTQPFFVDRLIFFLYSTQSAQGSCQGQDVVIGARSCGCPITVVIILDTCNWIPMSFAWQSHALGWVPTGCLPTDCNTDCIKLYQSFNFFT